jgi:hypothetical protein
MISVENKNHLFAASLLSKVGKVKECSLCELVNVEVTEANNESLINFILKTGEVLETLRSIEAHSRINFDKLVLSILNLEKLLEL